MSFWAGVHLQDFLFKGLNVDSAQGIAGIFIGLLSTAILYEGLRTLRDVLITRFGQSQKLLINSHHSSFSGREEDIPILPRSSKRPPKIESTVRYNKAGKSRNQSDIQHDEGETEEGSKTKRFDPQSQQGTPLLLQNEQEANMKIRKWKSITDLGLSSIFHMIYVFIGYTLMNAVMTFNIYIFIAVILGVGIGYLLFSPFRFEQVDVNTNKDQSSSTTESDDLLPSTSSALLGERREVSTVSRVVFGAQVHSQPT